jgi:hypothetical protein
MLVLIDWLAIQFGADSRRLAPEWTAPSLPASPDFTEFDLTPAGA